MSDVQLRKRASTATMREQESSRKKSYKVPERDATELVELEVDSQEVDYQKTFEDLPERTKNAERKAGYVENKLA
jgi:hypothetical protein